MKSFIFGILVGVAGMDIAFGLPVYNAINNSAMVKDIQSNPPVRTLKMH
jgi:hypothetical protein